MENENKLNQFEYELPYWNKTFGSPAIEIIISADESESYEIDAFHVFKLENGKYATVYENGCSCYDYARDAEIELFPDKEKALEQFYKWQKEQGE